MLNVGGWSRRYGGRLALAGLVMAAGAVALGATLGTFFWGLFLGVLLLPVFCDDEDLLKAFCLTDAVAGIWLVVVIADRQIGLWAWLSAYLLLLSVIWAQWCLLVVLRRWIKSAATAGALATLLFLAWLAAPIWLLPHMQGQGLLPWMQRVIDLHPLFAMNAAIPLGIWTELPMTYRLTNLNQDVYYAMPANIWWCVGVHLVAGAGWGLIWIKGPRPAAR